MDFQYLSVHGRMLTFWRQSVESLTKEWCRLHISTSAFALLYEDPRLDHEARSLFCTVVYLRPVNIADLTTKTGLGQHKITRICRNLAEYGWLRLLGQGRSLKPVCWVPKEYQERLIKDLEAHYALTPFGGEFLFGRILEYRVDVPCFIHNARPDFLKHPKTKEPLELDFLAPGVLGGEFHGQQHYAETQMYSKQSVEETQARDLVKEALCVRLGLPLIVVNAKTLGIESVTAMLPPNIPLHDIDLSDPYPQRLDRLCTLYRRKVERIPQTGSAGSQ